MTIQRRFRLQPVLNLKEMLEDRLQVDLAARQAEEERQRQMLTTLEAERTRQIRELGRATGTGPLNMTTIGASLSYLTRVEHHVDDQSAAAAQANVATSATRGALAQAMRERKVLETLRDQQRQALRQHLRHLEAAQAEETALSRYARRRPDATEHDGVPTSTSGA